MRYDDASWHYNGDYPAGSPKEFGGTHIALFLKWCFRQGWAGHRHLQKAPKETRAVIDGLMTASDFFFRFCGGKLTNKDLSPEGNAFAGQYYGNDGLYTLDFSTAFTGLVYRAPEEAHDFTTLDGFIKERRLSGVLTFSRSVSWNHKEREKLTRPKRRIGRAIPAIR